LLRCSGNHPLTLFHYLAAPMLQKISVCWFRRDLRLNDHTALWHAIQSGYPVLPLFIFDPNILNGLPKNDARVTFIHQALTAMHQQLRPSGGGMQLLHAAPMEAFQQLLLQYDIQAVYTNHDYEPYAQQRDSEIQDSLGELGIRFFSFKDQVVFEKHEVVKDDGSPYTVFTPYSKKWKLRWTENPEAYQERVITLLSASWVAPNPEGWLSLSDIGFEPTELALPPTVISVPIP
jgi:deoxyribodipyrimidine photo-lyase